MIFYGRLVVYNGVTQWAEIRCRLGVKCCFACNDVLTLVCLVPSSNWGEVHWYVTKHITLCSLLCKVTPFSVEGSTGYALSSSSFTCNPDCTFLSVFAFDILTFKIIFCSLLWSFLCFSLYKTVIIPFHQQILRVTRVTEPVIRFNKCPTIWALVWVEFSTRV